MINVFSASQQKVNSTLPLCSFNSVFFIVVKLQVEAFIHRKRERESRHRPSGQKRHFFLSLKKKARYPIEFEFMKTIKKTSSQKDLFAEKFWKVFCRKKLVLIDRSLDSIYQEKYI